MCQVFTRTPPPSRNDQPTTTKKDSPASNTPQVLRILLRHLVRTVNTLEPRVRAEVGLYVSHYPKFASHAVPSSNLPQDPPCCGGTSWAGSHLVCRCRRTHSHAHHDQDWLSSSATNRPSATKTYSFRAHWAKATTASNGAQRYHDHNHLGSAWPTIRSRLGIFADRCIKDKYIYLCISMILQVHASLDRVLT